MRSRVVGVDVARCLALIGMMATHVLPGVVDGDLTLTQQVAGGRASALFAVLAGVSLVLLSGQRTPLVGRDWWTFVAGVTVRSLCIGGLGLLLGELDTGIAVILVYYAVLFVAATPFLRLSTRALAWTAVGWVVLAPVLSHLLRSHVPPTSYDVPSLRSLGSPLILARELVLTGYYPVLTWLAYLVVGILIGRLDLRRPLVATRLAAVGCAAMGLAWAGSELLLRRPGVLERLEATLTGASRAEPFSTMIVHGLYGTTPTGSWWWLAVRGAHTGTSFDLLMTIGSACLVLGLCLLLGERFPRAMGIAFGAGAMTLTLYAAHVVSRTEGRWDGEDWPTFLGQVAVAVGIGAVFGLARAKGPLEWVVADLSKGARRLAARRG